MQGLIQSNHKQNHCTGWACPAPAGSAGPALRPCGSSRRRAFDSARVRCRRHGILSIGGRLESEPCATSCVLARNIVFDAFGRGRQPQSNSHPPRCKERSFGVRAACCRFFRRKLASRPCAMAILAMLEHGRDARGTNPPPASWLEPKHFTQRREGAERTKRFFFASPCDLASLREIA
jgi:hypothetical protein